MGGELPAHRRECGFALSPVLGHRKWHLSPTLALAWGHVGWWVVPFRGRGWLRGGEIQSVVSSRMQCPGGDSQGHLLGVVVWEGEQAGGAWVSPGIGSRSLCRRAAPLSDSNGGMAP